MTEKKINIAGDCKEIIVREGEAQKIYNPLKIEIVGTLKAPFEFIQSKLAGTPVTEMGVDIPLTLGKEETIYDPKRSHLLVNYREGSIVLVLNEKDNFKDTITGRLKEDESWQEFNINKEKLMQLNEVIKLIKRNKFKFADP